MADTTDEILTAKDVHGILKLSIPGVYKLAERGQLPCIRWKCPGDGKKKPRTVVRFKKSDVLDFIREHYGG